MEIENRGGIVAGCSLLPHILGLLECQRSPNHRSPGLRLWSPRNGGIVDDPDGFIAERRRWPGRSSTDDCPAQEKQFETATRRMLTRACSRRPVPDAGS